MTSPLPTGFRLTVDPDTKELDPTTLVGGSPARLLRLSAIGAAAWKELREGSVCSSASGTLARRLTDAGLAHPCPTTTTKQFDVTVVIPVRDRGDMLDRCLTALGTHHPVLIVDDGSTDPDAIAAIAARHGAGLLRRETNGGPAAARNAGLASSASELVAFLDSDCMPPAGWISALVGHFADPLVAAVAPRIVGSHPTTPLGRYAAAFGSLDLGERAARVVPSTGVAYVPTAALLARRSALEQVAGDGNVFDPALRYGEDVDLVWRLHEANWRIRYDPTVHIAHHEPDTWRALLTRRFRYGTSAAPLTLRHPDAMHPLILHAGPTATVLALLARRPPLAAVAFGAYGVALARALRRAGVPAQGGLGASVDSVRQTWLGIGRYLTQFAAPVLLAAFLVGGRRRWGRRAAVLSLFLAPAATPAKALAPGLVTRAFGRLADDLAYGAGVWAGCVRSRTVTPLAPVITVRPFRATTVNTESGRSSR